MNPRRYFRDQVISLAPDVFLSAYYPANYEAFGGQALIRSLIMLLKQLMLG